MILIINPLLEIPEKSRKTGIQYLIVNVLQMQVLGFLSNTFCLLLMPGLLGVEVGECLEMGVESWLLDPVPLAERRHRAGEKGEMEGVRQKDGGRRGSTD